MSKNGILLSLLDKIREEEREIGRAEIIRDIQAFVGEYSHEVTHDNEKRMVVIIDQLFDFLSLPSDS
jgi:metal-responsive CopG/Arc/MetJ family transcriptional regulator